MKEKSRTTIYIEIPVLKEFKIQSITMGKTISERINEFMKEEIKKGRA